MSHENGGNAFTLELKRSLVDKAQTIVQLCYYIVKCGP